MTVERRQRALLAVAVALALCVVPAVATAGETASISFDTAGEHAFVVPAAVTSLQVRLVGGHGAAVVEGGPGGAGATVTATLAVTPGERLFAEVGADAPPVGEDSGPGGSGGGASGGEHNVGFATFAGGGGGGGASDVRTCSEAAVQSSCPGGSSLESRLIVAGGGGGGGGAGKSSAATGGAGGSAEHAGSSGGEELEHGQEGGSGGGRGTGAAGGALGSPSADCSVGEEGFCADAGKLGGGGQGGTAPSGGGGGGGGGIFGGGGGGAGAADVISLTEWFDGGGGGGGGGSSGVPVGASGVSDVLMLATAEGAEPSVAISWSAPAPTVVTSAASAILPTVATLNGSVDLDEWPSTGCGFEISPAPAGVPTFPCAQQLSLDGGLTAVSATAPGLTPGVTYTVMLTASSSQGSSTGAPVEFTTPAVTAGVTALSATDLALSHPRFRRGTRPATIARDTRKGLPASTTISFTVSQAATVTLGFAAAETGVRVGSRCDAVSKREHRGKSCTRYAAVRRDLTLAAPAGADRITFDGVLGGGSRLAPGSYRLSLTASSATAKAVAAQHPSFTLVG